MIEYDMSARPYIKQITDEETDGYLAQVIALDNKDLLDYTIDLSAGDDWDGELTYHGGIVFNMLREELTKRLQQIGFLE